MFLLNVLFALAWLLLTGQFTPGNFAFGFVTSYLLLWLTARVFLPSTMDPKPLDYFNKSRRWLGFIIFFLKELIVSNLRVAIAVLHPRLQLRPAVVTVPLGDLRDSEVTMLANLLTLTPGTLSLDVATKATDDDVINRRVLRVHVIDVGFATGAVAQFRQRIMHKYVTQVREVMR